MLGMTPAWRGVAGRRRWPVERLDRSDAPVRPVAGDVARPWPARPAAGSWPAWRPTGLAHQAGHAGPATTLTLLPQPVQDARAAGGLPAFPMRLMDHRPQGGIGWWPWAGRTPHSGVIPAAGSLRPAPAATVANVRSAAVGAGPLPPARAYRGRPLLFLRGVNFGGLSFIRAYFREYLKPA